MLNHYLKHYYVFHYVKTLLQKQQPLTYYTPCGAHRGHLLAQAVGTSVAIKDELTLIHEIGLIFSGKIKFRHIHSQNLNETTLFNKMDYKKI